MPGIADVLNPSEALISGSISGAGAAGRDTIDSIVDGARGASGAAFGAGQQIGAAMVSGLLQPLGASGAAIGALAKTLATDVQDMIGSGIAGAGQLLASGGQIVGTLAGAISIGAGAAIGLAFGGPLIGAAIGGGIALLVGSLVGVIGDGLGALAKVAGDAMGKLGDVAGKGFETMISVVEDVFNSAITRARSVGDLAYSTGMPFSGAAQTAQNFGALGIGADKVAGMMDASGQNPMIMGMKAKMFGLPNVDDPNFQSSLATKYQDLQSHGPIGVMQSRSMMNMMGMDNPAMRRAASLDPSRIREEQTFTRNLNRDMGMNPETIRKFSEEFPLLTNRISQAVDIIKIKFASELMDGAGAGLLRLASVISNNSGAIVGALTTAATWIVNDLPVAVLAGLEMMLGGGQMFLNGISAFMGSLAGALDDFANGSGIIFQVLSPIATAIDFISVGFRGLAQLLLPLGAILQNFQMVTQSVAFGLLNVIKTVASSVVVGPLLRLAGLGDVADAARDMHLPTLMNGGMQFKNPMDEFKRASALPQLDVSGALLNLQNSNVPKDAAKWLNQNQTKVQSGADWLGKQKETVAGYRDDFPALLAEMKRQTVSLDRVADNTKDTANNTKGDPSGMESAGRFLTRVVATNMKNNLARG